MRYPDYQFENPMGIPLMLRFFDYGNDASIPQDSFDSISSFGGKMLTHLAAWQGGAYFELVHQAIREHLKSHTWLNEVLDRPNEWLKIAHPEGLKQLRNLLKTLEFQHYQKQEIPINEAVETWQQLQSY